MITHDGAPDLQSTSHKRALLAFGIVAVVVLLAVGMWTGWNFRKQPSGGACALDSDCRSGDCVIRHDVFGTSSGEGLCVDTCKSAANCARDESCRAAKDGRKVCLPRFALGY